MLTLIEKCDFQYLLKFLTHDYMINNAHVFVTILHVSVHVYATKRTTNYILCRKI